LKLLFDENLSPRLVELLAFLYPGSQHVYFCNLGASPDRDIWEYAKEHEFVIVSKDSDFSERSIVHGHPPKVVWLRVGNCTTDQVALFLLNTVDALTEFAESEEHACLIRKLR
jgi:predicted nuclease of predicted toxin-antitoxin system